MAEMKKFCVIIPGYNEHGRIGKVVEGVKRHAANVVVIDDGSKDDTAAEAEKAGAVVLRHEVNKGKGMALGTGFKYARDNGFEFVITMDADGQHAPEDVQGFIAAYVRGDAPVIVGSRMDRTETMPLVRKLTNRFMSWLLSRKMGQRVPDTQSGYRLFRCDVIPDVPAESGRFAAESEILLMLSHAGVKIGSVPIQVIYRDEKSKIHPFKDTIRFFAMLKRYDKRRKESAR